MLRSAQRYSQVALAPIERTVEGMSRKEATLHFQGKILLIARQLSERLPADSSVFLEDLVSYGAIGLLEAFDRYDSSRQILFSTFAEYRIRGAMLDALRSNDTFTRRRRQLAKRIEAVSGSLKRELGRNPDPEEVADCLQIDMDQYWAAVDRVKPISLVSIDVVLQDEDGGEGRALVEQLTTAAHSDPSHDLDVAEVKRHLKEAVKALPEKQRHCVMMYYGKDLSLAEIAAVYEVTPSRISQILSQAKQSLRKKLRHLVEPGDLGLELGQ